jgi:hypothetical protein
MWNRQLPKAVAIEFVGLTLPLTELILHIWKRSFRMSAVILPKKLSTVVFELVCVWIPPR